MTAPTFTPGARVALNTGGPEMTVEAVRDDGWMHTVWFDGAELCRDAFPTAGLKQIGRIRLVSEASA